MNDLENLKIGIIGLGYVGLPLAVEFSKKFETVGYDIDFKRIKELEKFEDKTLEIDRNELSDVIRNHKTIFTFDIDHLKDCNFFIVTVPTPIDKNNQPLLDPLFNATRTVGNILKKGDFVVYESTVYPGCTEEDCLPILEHCSGLKLNQDFYLGYSPERINPGDKHHTLSNITKVTSGSSNYSSKIIDSVYSKIIDAGTYMASSIKVAEAAKVIENSQRDINIAFVNELAKIFSHLNLDTKDVLDAASTKWNFLNFRPGLVGGHCIGVDPYYLAEKSIKEGYKPEIILSGRKLNDGMGEFIANEIVNLFSSVNIEISGAKVIVLGATFKENCPDFRNTKVIDLVESLISRGVEVNIFDPWIDSEMFRSVHNYEVSNKLSKSKYDAVVLAVSHSEFRKINLDKLKKSNDSIVYDIKSFFNKNQVTKRL